MRYSAFMFLLICACQDDTHSLYHLVPLNPPYEKYQNYMMLRLTGADEALNKELYLLQTRFLEAHGFTDNVCWWKHCFCTHGIMHRMHWPRSNGVLNVDLAWFPSTLEVIQGTYVHLRKPLPIRCLPARLLRLEMEYCELIGELEMNILPHNLLTALLRENLFLGMIFLENMPPKMQKIDLTANNISTVYMGDNGFHLGLEISVVRQKRNKKATVHWREGREQKGNVFMF